MFVTAVASPISRSLQLRVLMSFFLYVILFIFFVKVQTFLLGVVVKLDVHAPTSVPPCTVIDFNGCDLPDMVCVEAKPICGPGDVEAESELPVSHGGRLTSSSRVQLRQSSACPRGRTD